MPSPVPFLQSFYDVLAGSAGAVERPVWNEEAKRWFVVDPSTASLVLRSDDFSVVKHHEEVEAMQAALAIDLQATVDAARSMPLSHEGDEHRRLKRMSTQMIQDSLPSALITFSSSCSTLLPRLFESRKMFDVVTDFVSPVSIALFAALSGAEEVHFNRSLPAGYCPTQLLTSAKRSLSAPRWRALNRQIEERNKRIEGHSSHRQLRAALSLLTFEIFKAALSNSLIDVFRRNAGRLLSEGDIPGQLPCTSIPFVDRVCRRDTEIRGEQIRRGENVLLYLGGCSPADHERRKLFFGTGPHICVGKSLTENAWVIIAELLRKRREKVLVRDVSYRDFDVILLSPVRATIEIVK
jgi:cytochrome P450